MPTPPSATVITSNPTPGSDLTTLLNLCRPFLRGELHLADPDLPSHVALLRSVGAGECWHKHGSFLDHLIDLYKILYIWRTSPAICLCGLFHSAYSNSYVNLAIFDPSTGRDEVRRHIGTAAERLVHLFCVVPRQPLIHDDLLFRYSDEEALVRDLKASEEDVRRVREGMLGDVMRVEEGWRGKLNDVLGNDGVVVKHIRTGEDVRVSRRIVAVFLMMTMGDFSDQLFGFQDELFQNHDGRLEFAGKNMATLWPGDGKPGLWMNSISRMGAIYTLLAREEEIFIEERRRSGGVEVDERRDEDIELVIPPVFDNCTKVLNAADQILARDLYWEALCGSSGSSSSEEKRLKKAEELLVKSVEMNPFVGEPRVVLSQVYLGQGRYEEAEKEAGEGLRKLLEWGSPWDKRTSWEGWVAWCRVLLMKAKEKSAWPDNGWGVLNLGLVK